jgi:hypothetical protein
MAENSRFYVRRRPLLFAAVHVGLWVKLWGRPSFGDVLWVSSPR